MPRNFYYEKDATIVSGSANFASLISTGFAGYGLTSAQATGFGTLNTSLQGVYSVAIEPSTKTRVTVAAKNLAIKNMRANAVLLSKIIYATPAVTDGQLVGLGLLPRSTRAPVPAPTTAPVLEVVSVSGRLVNIRLHGAPPDSTRAKPPGATGANVYSFVGEAPPADPRAYHFEGMATRTITQIIFPNTVASGATVWLSACWVSARGATSVPCTPISFNIQGGGVLPMEA